MIQAQSASLTRGNQGSNEQAKELSTAGWRRCWACTALNDRDKSTCTPCRTLSCGVAPNLSSTYVDRLSDGLRESIKSVRVGPLPWILTPSVLPIPSSVVPPFAAGWFPKDRVDNDLISNPFTSEDGGGSLPGRVEPFYRGGKERSERPVRSQDLYDLGVAFSNMNCDDGYQRRDTERARMGVSTFG
ncbi:hypothetical protein FGB62_339g09 [Gracilaria domingensis]|nr:hypothetical protein FGB62_339g09 [Gracilaria domingensis]